MKSPQRPVHAPTGVVPVTSAERLELPAIARHQPLHGEGELGEQGRLLLLAEFSGIVVGSLDYASSGARLAELLVPAFADCCMLEITGSAAAPPVTIVHADPRHRLTVQQLCSARPSDPFSLRSGEPVGSGIGRRLAARGHDVGMLSLVRFGKRRPYSAQDVSFAENLIDQLALAVDSARLYQEAQRAIQVREDLLATVSHDLKNPLSVVCGTLTSMLRMWPADAPARLRAQIERVNRAATMMDELIHLLLDRVSIQTGRLSLEPGRIQVGPLIHAATDMFHSVAAERRIQLDIACHVDPRFVFTADRGRILQVLSNVLGNALKFTPPEGRVTLACAIADADIRFSVTDSGCGIPAQHLTRIFDLHWHASRERRGGTGLGLFIARGIVEAHHGTISAASVVGQGTTVTFSIPHTPPHSP